MSAGIDTVDTSYYQAPTNEGSAPMRGPDEQTSDRFGYVSPEQRVRPDHPRRAIRGLTDDEPPWARGHYLVTAATGIAESDAVAMLLAGVRRRTSRPTADSARSVDARRRIRATPSVSRNAHSWNTPSAG
jgi:hypothetical protein